MYELPQTHSHGSLDEALLASGRHLAQRDTVEGKNEINIFENENIFLVSCTNYSTCLVLLKIFLYNYSTYTNTNQELFKYPQKTLAVSHK